MVEVLPFCGKLDGFILEWLLKPDVLFLTGRFARDMGSARVVIGRRLLIVQESQWREFKIDSNEIVSSKLDASRLFGAGVAFYLFKNRSSGAGVLLLTSKAVMHNCGGVE